MTDVDPIEGFAENAAETETTAMEFDAAVNGDGLTVFAVDSLDDQWISCDKVMKIER